MKKSRAEKDRRWPSVLQECLLKAALTSGASCLDSWQHWKNTVNIGRLDQTSRRMVPLLYHNLRREGIDDPLLETFRGIYRYTWYSNQLLFNAAAALLRLYQKHNIQVALLKGAAMITVYYKDCGLRPMHDFDILIPPHKAREAIGLMTDEGWIPSHELPEKISDTYLRYVHGTVLKNPSGFDCDLHWNILEDSYLNPEGADFFQNARKVQFQNLTALVLNPSDQLFHICVHGLRYHHGQKNIRWIADALTLINEAGREINWQVLVDRSRKLGLFVSFKEALLYLHRIFSIPLPALLLENISRISVSKYELKEFKLKSRDLGRIGWIRYNWLKNARSLEKRGINRTQTRWLEFLKFYQNMWGIDTLWKLPLEKLKRTFKSAAYSLRKK